MAKQKTLKKRHIPMFDLLFFAALVFAFFTMLWFMITSTSFMIFGDIVTRVDTKEKVVALTFDDGPLPGTTEATLDALKQEKVRATFFVIGLEAKRHPDQLEKIIKAGHELGNHSFSHKNMAFMMPDEVAKEVEMTDALLQNAGYKGPIEFRTPYNAKFITLPYYLMTHHRLDISRDILPAEGRKKTPQAIAAEVVKRTRPGSIILLHPMYAHTASTRQAIKPIVRELRAEGYRFVTISELLQYRKRP